MIISNLTQRNNRFELLKENNLVLTFKLIPFTRDRGVAPQVTKANPSGLQLPGTLFFCASNKSTINLLLEDFGHRVIQHMKFFK